MTPTLLALSRAYLALPVAPRRDSPAMMPCDTDVNTGYRDTAGLRWVWDPEWSDFRVLDLTDAATGGVMLERLGAIAALDIHPTRPTADAVRWWGYWLNDDSWRDVPPSDHLAEAVARAAVALGRAG